MKRAKPKDSRPALNLSVPVNIYLDELAETLVMNGDREAAFELIKAIDLAHADVEFTEMLAKHFLAELKKEFENGPEQFNLQDYAP